MQKFDSDYFTEQTSASFVSLESLLLKSTRPITDKYQLLSVEQLTSFPAQMKYEAYDYHTEPFFKSWCGRHEKNDDWLTENLSNITEKIEAYYCSLSNTSL